MGVSESKPACISVIVRLRFVCSLWRRVFSRHTWRICPFCTSTVGSSGSHFGALLVYKCRTFWTKDCTDCSGLISKRSLCFRWWHDRHFLWCFWRRPSKCLVSRFCPVSWCISHKPSLTISILAGNKIEKSNDEFQMWTSIEKSGKTTKGKWKRRTTENFTETGKIKPKTSNSEIDHWNWDKTLKFFFIFSGFFKWLK